MVVSYAQNFEDAILWKALKHVKQGFYIDIGAQDPIVDSVSLAFYEQGWRGVHVEPSSFYANLLREARPDEEVIEAAISSVEKSLKFFEFPHTGLSTGDEAVARALAEKGFECRTLEVPCLPLSQLLDTYKDKEIGWMKIDVEGMERAVIESWLPSSVRPQIIVVESTVPMTSVPAHGAWESEVLRLGYTYVFFDGVNRYYVSDAHPELKSEFGLRLGVFDGVVLSGCASSPVYAAIRAKQLSELHDAKSAYEQEISAYEREIASLKQRIAVLETDISGAFSRSYRKFLKRIRKKSQSAALQRSMKSPKKYYRTNLAERLLLALLHPQSLARRMKKPGQTTKPEGGD